MDKCKYCGCDIRAGEQVGEYCSREHWENSEVFMILEDLTDELDITFGATTYPWKVHLTSAAYDTLKNRPGTEWDVDQRAYVPRNLVYEKDGHEYLRCWENHNIPFIVHARIADKNALHNGLELDDLNRPNIKEEYRRDCDAAWEAECTQSS